MLTVQMKLLISKQMAVKVLRRSIVMEKVRSQVIRRKRKARTKKES